MTSQQNPFIALFDDIFNFEEVVDNVNKTKEGNVNTSATSDLGSLLFNTVHNSAKNEIKFELEVDNHESIDVVVIKDDENHFTDNKQFTALLGKDGVVLITVDDYEFDKDLSDIGNSKVIINNYLEDNPLVLDLLDTLSENENSSIIGIKTDTVKETVDTFNNIMKHSANPVVPLIEFPAEHTFEVICNDTLWENNREPFIISAGNKNILTIKK